MRGGDQLLLPVAPHLSGLWLGIRILVENDVGAFMVLDSGSPQSVISPALGQELQSRGVLHATSDSRYFRLTNLTARAHQLPDVRVRILPRLARLQIDGLLGLDFFRAFELVCFRLSTSELLLEYAPSSPR
jgi:hypothetical protein